VQGTSTYATLRGASKMRMHMRQTQLINNNDATSTIPGTIDVFLHVVS
jgi:hypothetical protein